MTKVKKGDVVAVKTNHSSKDIGTMKRKAWVTFSLARAARCDRKGLVARIQMQPNGPAYMLDFFNQTVFRISDPDNQAASARLFDANGENTYPDIKAIKAAIVAEKEKNV
jgi:hypothetical protein